MYNPLEVKKDIYWVGALDRDIKVFDIVMYTKFGTTYNSFILNAGDTNILFEVSKEKFFDEFFQRASKICDISKIEYVVVNHTEPDHTGSFKKLLEINPNIKVIGTATAIKFLKDIVNKKFESIVVKDGEVLEIGNRTLKFIVAPFLHWPDTMMTYSVEDKTIFSCDFLGCHYCTDIIFNDLITEDFSEAFKYYFDVIMGPFKQHILNAIDKISELDLEIVATGHGPVLRKDINKYIDLYKKWATPIKKERPLILMPYVSSYNFTKTLAEKIREGIESTGDFDIIFCDLTYDDKENLYSKLEIADAIIIGSPTIISDTVPPIWELLAKLNPFINKGMIAGVFGSYGWSGEAVKNIEERLNQLRFKIPVESLKVIFNPSEEELQKAIEFGKKIAESIKK